MRHFFILPLIAQYVVINQLTAAVIAVEVPEENKISTTNEGVDYESEPENISIKQKSNDDLVIEQDVIPNSESNENIDALIVKPQRLKRLLDRRNISKSLVELQKNLRDKKIDVKRAINDFIPRCKSESFENIVSSIKEACTKFQPASVDFKMLLFGHLLTTETQPLTKFGVLMTCAFASSLGFVSFLYFISLGYTAALGISAAVSLWIFSVSHARRSYTLLFFQYHIQKCFLR